MNASRWQKCVISTESANRGKIVFTSYLMPDGIHWFVESDDWLLTERGNQTKRGIILDASLQPVEPNHD